METKDKQRFVEKWELIAAVAACGLWFLIGFIIGYGVIP